MNDLSDVEVGDKLWFSSAVRSLGSAYVTIVKVGRKWLIDDRGRRYYFDGERDSTGNVFLGRLYRSKEEHDGLVLKRDMNFRLVAYFRDLCRGDYSVEQIKAVAEILGIQEYFASVLNSGHVGSEIR